MAREALELGLVHQIVPNGQLDSAAMELAGVLASKSRAALMAAKRAINMTQELPLHNGLEEEMREWALMFDTPDQKEAMSAFLEKRKPRYSQVKDAIVEPPAQ
jgi:enoyl-CoA hydratase/carnithine racemase